MDYRQSYIFFFFFFKDFWQCLRMILITIFFFYNVLLLVLLSLNCINNMNTYVWYKKSSKGYLGKEKNIRKIISLYLIDKQQIKYK